MNFVPKSLNSLVKLQQMFRIAEIELGMENTIGITLETGVAVESTILHVCQSKYQWSKPDGFQLSVGYTIYSLLTVDEKKKKKKGMGIKNGKVT